MAELTRADKRDLGRIEIRAREILEQCAMLRRDADQTADGDAERVRWMFIEKCALQSYNAAVAGCARYLRDFERRMAETEDRCLRDFERRMAETENDS